MRHRKAGRKLGISSSHRKALMRNLVTALLEHGQIKTTLAKAKEMRKPLDKMVGLGKRGDLHARRQALTFIKSKAAMAKLFGEYAELYKNRNGGYSRIFRIGHRLGDNAAMALIQMMGEKSENKGKTSETAATETSTSLEEVKSELEQTDASQEQNTASKQTDTSQEQNTAPEQNESKNESS